MMYRTSRRPTSNNPRKSSLDAVRATVIVAIITGIASITGAWVTGTLAAKRQAEAARVEIGSVTSNSNGPDFDNPWMPSEDRYAGGRTVVLGVRRKICFDKPFRNTPIVHVSLNAINVATLEETLERLLKRSNIDSTLLQGELCVGATALGVNPKEFTLDISICLRSNVADTVISYLQNRPVDMGLVDIHRRTGRLPPDKDQLTHADKWMLNFYETVGTIDATWIAVANEPLSE